MKWRRTIILAGATLLAWGFSGVSAVAQGPWPSLGWHSSGYYALEYQIGNIPTPPYFAIHPPVYYGKRVGMPYGNSPYPRPPRAVQQESIRWEQAPVVGVMIRNPYVESEKKQKGRKRRKPADKGGSKLRILTNPYVVNDGSTNQQESLVAN